MPEKAHLHERMDRLFGNGSMSQHRTLRTLFDPGSSEWEETTMEQKVAMLKKILVSGEDLFLLSLQYKAYYTDDCNKPHVARNYENGLRSLLIYLLEHDTSGAAPAAID